MPISRFPMPFSLAPQQLAQMINPLNWLNSGTGQIGFVNISSAASSKPQVEADIVENVATYGRQLGRISEVLVAVLEHLKADGWTGPDRAAVRAFDEMNAKIAVVKAGHLAPTRQAVDDFVAGLRCLAETDRAEYERIVAQVRDALSLDGARRGAAPRTTARGG